MLQTPPSTRRDRRIDLPPASAFLEFHLSGSEGPGGRGEVVTVSSSGLAFDLDLDSGVEVGATLVSATVRFDGRLAEGDMVVRYSRPSGRSRVELGCLFYPASLEDSARWMAFVSERSGASPCTTLRLPIRCSNCHDTIWIFDDLRSSDQCSTCNQAYDLARWFDGRRLADLHQLARDSAMRLGIDLAAAASIELGLMTLTGVHDVLGETPSSDSWKPSREADKATGFDRAFGPAVEAGTLSRAQAIQRGNRGTYARTIVARHRISLEDAYAVADNRTSLLLVMRNRQAGKRIKVPTDRRVFFGDPPSVAASVALLLVAILGVIGQLVDTQNLAIAPPPTEPAGTRSDGVRAVELLRPTPTPTEEVVRDAAGRPVRISASRPEAVLRSYCRENARQPLALAAGMIRDPNLWLGVYFEIVDPHTSHAIAIRKDRTTGRWTAGDGTSPIRFLTVQPEQLGQTHDLVASASGR